MNGGRFKVNGHVEEVLNKLKEEVEKK